MISLYNVYKNILSSLEETWFKSITYDEILEEFTQNLHGRQIEDLSDLLLNTEDIMFYQIEPSQLVKVVKKTNPDISKEDLVDYLNGILNKQGDISEEDKDKISGWIDKSVNIYYEGF